jgi:hypothetical protein
MKDNAPLSLGALAEIAEFIQVVETSLHDRRAFNLGIKSNRLWDKMHVISGFPLQQLVWLCTGNTVASPSRVISSLLTAAFAIVRLSVEDTLIT